MDFNWSQLFAWPSLRNVIDIAIVWFLIYHLLVIIRGTKAVHLMKGLVLIAAMKLISFVFRLNTLDWIMNLVIQWGVVGAIVVFQPEIRKGLETIGRTNLFSKRSIAVNPTQRMIEELSVSAAYMAKRRIGALIAIEQKNSLDEYIHTGISLGADISNQLVTNIFIPNTPLHDGAVIIRDNQIQAAACYLPLSESSFIPKELGTRHRAAIGLSEVTDALTIVISEETGKISIALKERLLRDLTIQEFEDFLHQELVFEEEGEKPDTILAWLVDFFKGGRTKDE